MHIPLPTYHPTCPPYQHVPSQIFGLSDREELERGANAVAKGFVGLAVFSGVIFFLAVRMHACMH